MSLDRGSLKRRGTVLRVLGRMLLAAIALLVIVPLVAWLWMGNSVPSYSGEVRLPGLQAHVRISRDQDAVPRIRADNRRDAYFALGFVHAQDRILQMETQRRLVQGRTAELVGGWALPADRMMRTLGLQARAERSVARLSPPLREALDAYAAGVNAWLRDRQELLPPAFQLLLHEPDPWTPADSIAWGGLMSIQLSSNWRTEALRARLAAVLDPVRMAQLWPLPPEGSPVTMDLATTLRGLYRQLAWPDPREIGLERAGTGASNAWTLGASLSATGGTVLANDPHLGLTAPTLWHLARVDAPDLTLVGAFVPGVPLLIIGHNGRVAWGFTTTHGDTQDLFIERLERGNPGNYLTPDGPRPFAVRQEVIEVRWGTTDVLTVRETRHGPVISDLTGRAGVGAALEAIDARFAATGEAAEGQHVIALAWPALRDDDRTPEALFALNQAGSARAAREALRDFHGPLQNVFFADRDGNHGFVAAGLIPIRAAGDGGVPVPGWTGEYDWTGFIPFDELPQAFNPASDRLVNANNRVAPPSYPYLISSEFEPHYRAARIEQVIDALTADGRKMTVDQSVALQNDTVSFAAVELLPRLLEVAPAGGREARARDLLLAWDRRMLRDRPEPLLFKAWLSALTRLLYADELGEDLYKAYRGWRAETVQATLSRHTHWCDDTTDAAPQDCDSMVARALTEALDLLEDELGGDMTGWRWGTLHAASVRHPLFGRIPVLGALAGRDVPIDGGNYTVNRAGPTLFPSRLFRAVHGAGVRVVFDLADLESSRFIIATGQSGNVLSPHFDDMADRWADGLTRTLTMNPPPEARITVLAPGG